VRKSAALPTETRTPERILVIEDDAFFRELYSDLLRQEGYEVFQASTGAEALALLESREFPVVVTDLVLEDISGLEILSRVKQLDPAIEVIMVTGHANMETAITALKSGARDYLVKPINHDEFKHVVALCLEQRRLLEENQELKHQIHLYQVSQTIASCLDLERLHSLVVDSLAKEVGVSRAVAFFVEGIGTLALREVKGLPEGVARKVGGVILANFNWMDEKVTGFVRLTNFLKPESVKNGRDIREALLLFVRSRTTPLGVVMLFNDPGKSLPADLNYRNLNFLLDQASLAIENAVHYTTASKLLNIDELTSLFNYRYLELALDKETKRADRFGCSLSLIFLDIDFLKTINDTHGHLVGSRILREMGTLLKRSVRDVDILIRYGGDEFTILLVETDVAGAAVVAERIRRTIEAHHFLADAGLDLRLTASLGYACYPDDTRSKTELLELADQAMYHGKTSGKNRVFHISSMKAS